jgi:diacylglycerol kinase family enzyme
VASTPSDVHAKSGCAFKPSGLLLFVINAGAGSGNIAAIRELIDSALLRAGRTGEILLAQPAELRQVARDAATRAKATHGAVIAIGGDGTINAVAQAAHDVGCAMGVVAQGTFNYFARVHGIPAEPASAIDLLLQTSPVPVQVASINEHIFLVNASLGLYPDLLEDREAYKARFGRSRLVALGAAFITLLRAHRKLRLQIQLGALMRKVRTPTLFVGNNRLQLEQIGIAPGAPGEGTLVALMLRTPSTFAMLGLIWRGAMGSLGEADSVESFEFNQMLVKPKRLPGRKKFKVAFDGEVTWLRAPLNFAVAAVPLYLLKHSAEAAPAPEDPSTR